MTLEERRLWNRLRTDIPWRFRRQVPIGPYIADFVCFAKRLIVEVDGAHHDSRPSDEIRTGRLREMGFEVIRFWNWRVQFSLDWVIGEIESALAQRPDLHRNRPARRHGVSPPSGGSTRTE